MKVGEHPLDKVVVQYVGVRGMPKYRNPDGTFSYIEGEYADNWRYPKLLRDESGEMYVQIPHTTQGWGITFHAVRRTKNPIKKFIKYYVEGRASGFPFWPTFHFSVKYALSRFWRKQ